MRARTIIITVVLGACALVIPATASASAANDYSAVKAILAGSETASGTADRLPSPDTYLAQQVASGGGQATTLGGDSAPAKQLFAGAGRSSSPSHAGGLYRSADSIVATSGPPRASQRPVEGQRYLDALVRSPAPSQPVSAPVAETRGGDGFQWGDALLGALIAPVVLLVMLAAGRSVARHRRASAESRA